MLPETKPEQMENTNRIRRLTEQDVAARYLLPPSRFFYGSFYAILLTATLALSVLSVLLFR